jgi:hypothetical protein
MPIPSRSVISAGHWHPKGQTSLASQARRAGYLPGMCGEMRWSRAGVPATPGARTCPPYRCQQHVRWLRPGARASGRGYGLRADGGQYERIPACPGGRARAATAGPDARSRRGFSGTGNARPRGLCAPGTAYRRVWRERGRRDRAGWRTGYFSLRAAVRARRFRAGHRLRLRAPAARDPGETRRIAGDAYCFAFG